MDAFVVNRTGDKIQVMLDARHFKEDMVARLLNRLYIEYLAEKIDFQEDIESLGDEIKRAWWEKNKAQILARINEGYRNT
jgi:hypothetical protein